MTAWFLSSRARVLLLAMGVVDIATLWPLFVFDRVPSMDGPNHAAIARVLWDGGSVAYAADPGLLPYGMAHLILGPLVHISGPDVGLRCFYLITAVATLLVLHAMLWRHSAPWFVHLAAPLIVFHASFFWGFLPMVLGLPVAISVLAAFAEYLRSRHRGWLGVALAASALATATHVLWLPAVALIWVAAVWLDPRSFWRVALLGLMATLLPALPGLLSGMEGSESPVLRFSTLGAAWGHFKRQWSAFDKGLGRIGGVLLLCGMAVAAWRGRGVASPVRSLALRVFALTLVLAVFAPVAISAASHHAWGVGFRYYVLAFAALLVSTLACRRELWLPWVFVAGLGLYVVGLGVAWHHFDQQTRETAHAIAELSTDAALWVDTEKMRLGEFSPPVDQHLAAAHVARGGLFASNVFAGAHIPIAVHSPTPRVTHALMRPNNEPPPGCGQVLHMSSRWVLYGCLR